MSLPRKVLPEVVSSIADLLKTLTEDDARIQWAHIRKAAFSLGQLHYDPVTQQIDLGQNDVGPEPARLSPKRDQIDLGQNDTGPKPPAIPGQPIGTQPPSAEKSPAGPVPPTPNG
jgi:hypothetical protein